MLTVHHLGISQSERIIWLCEELGVPYELEITARDPASRMAPESYKSLHPLGTAPVITDGDVVLAETGAIVDYIIARHGQGRLTVGPDKANFAEYLFWLHFAQGSMVPAGMIGLVITHLGASANGGLAKAMQARGDRAFELVEARLGEEAYFAGDDFTAADIVMLFPLSTMRVFLPRDLSPFPNIRAYLKRIGERPAYRRAMERGDPGFSPILD